MFAAHNGEKGVEPVCFWVIFKTRKGEKRSHFTALMMVNDAAESSGASGEV